MILLAAAGLLSLLAQVVLLRELVAALFGIELLYVVALGTWLAGTAVGAVAGRRLPGRPLTIALAFGALGALVPVELALVRMAGVIVGAVPGAYLPFPAQLAGIAAATAPPAAFCGLLFPALVRRAARQGLSPGRAYGWECAGAAAGGLVVTALFWLGVSTLQVAIITTALASMAAMLALTGRRGVIAAGFGIVALTAGATLAQSSAWDVWLMRWQYPSLLAMRDTPYARVVVTRMDGQLAVFQNGALAFDTEGTSAEGFADLAALQHPRPTRALVLGGGVEGVPAALAAHGLSAIDNIEVDERGDALVRALVAPARQAGANAAVVRVFYGEPRQFLASASTYDLILVAMPEPTSGETSRFYTREFFAICRRHLSPGGVLAIRMPAAENFWPPPLVRLVSTVVQAMAMEMPAVSIVPGATLYAFGSATELPATADLLVQRLAERRVNARIMTPPYLRYLYGNDRRDAVRHLLATVNGSDANRDAAPVCYRYAAMLWLSKFYPQVAANNASSGPGGAWALVGALVAALAGGLWWAGGTPRRSAVAFIGIVSGAVMVLETVALLRYQIANGVMFVNIGWLLTCFMGGMAAGAWYAGSAAPRRAAVLGRQSIVAGLAAVSASVAVMTHWDALAGFAGTSLILALAGAVAGAACSVAMNERPSEPSRGASSVSADDGDQIRLQSPQSVGLRELPSSPTALYAADVAGGALGAWLATLVLVPLLGLDGGAGLTAVLALAWLPLTLRRASARR